MFPSILSRYDYEYAVLGTDEGRSHSLTAKMSRSCEVHRNVLSRIFLFQKLFS